MAITVSASAGIFQQCVADSSCGTGPINGSCAVVEGNCYGSENYWVCSGRTACENAVALYCGSPSTVYTYTVYTGTCGGSDCSPQWDDGVLQPAVENPCS